MTRAQYSDHFYADLANTAEPSAAAIVPMLLERARIDSVVDVGCGDGGWLSVFAQHGVATILGVDGPWVSLDRLRIPKECFERYSLEESLPIDRRFGLSMSLEVAEHLQPARADNFVSELTRLAPLVLFSAAIPGQGGHHHVNEQWPGYWADRFARRGYRCLDVLRPLIWNDPRVTWWYKQNLLLFAAEEALAEHPALRAWAETAPAEPFDLVHPEVLRQMLRSANPGFGRWARSGWRALRTSLSRRPG